MDGEVRRREKGGVSARNRSNLNLGRCGDLSFLYLFWCKIVFVLQVRPNKAKSHSW